MRLSLVSQPPVLLGMGAAMFVGSVVMPLRNYVSTRHRITEVTRMLKSAPRATAVSLNGAEKTVSEAAKAAGLKRLLSVGSEGEGAAQELRLDWEGNTAATVRFLEQLKIRGATGPCTKLELSSAENDAGLLRAHAMFRLGGIPVKTAPLKLPARDAFRPLYHLKREDPSPVIINLHDVKKEEEDRRKAEAETERQRKEKDEADRLEAKKHQLETQLVLTGIVGSAGAPIAFVDSRGAAHRTLMLHPGDSVEEATVVSIDEKAGSLKLDYAGKFQVLLRLGSGESQ